MNVLVITESCFGCTATLGEAVAAGLRSQGATVTVADVASAPEVAPFDLVVLGAPTHHHAMSTPESRREAAERGGHPPERGIRELLATLPDGLRVALFDTVLSSWFAGSAAKRAARELRRTATVVATKSFTVTRTTLDEGEATRAEQWGASLAHT